MWTVMSSSPALRLKSVMGEEVSGLTTGCLQWHPRIWLTMFFLWKDANIFSVKEAL
jgi:hypothetical protein